MEYILNVANDLGYGSIKATLNDEKVKMPSVIASEKPQDITEPVSFDDQEQQAAYMKDFINKLDVSVSSSAVTKQQNHIRNPGYRPTCSCGFVRLIKKPHWLRAAVRPFY